jgi:hypothetical protein
VRQMHSELMQEAWRDPQLLQALEIIPDGRHELARRYVYLNSYFMYLRMGLISGQVTADEIEDLAAHSFSTSAGAFFWQRTQHLQKHFEPEFLAAMARGYERSQVRAEGAFLNEDWSDQEYATHPKPGIRDT